VRDSWEIRFEWIQTILVWVALVVGVGLSILEYGVEPETVVASVAATGYAIAIQAIPYRHKEVPLVAALLAFLGVVTALLAIGQTGGVDSPYVLYLAVPIYFASAFHGMRLGGVTTLAAIVGLVAVAATSGEDLLSPPLPAIVAFYALLGITFGQAHRILIEEPRTDSASSHYGRLVAAHQLLSDLAELAGSAELNPITIGRIALRDLAVDVPYAAGTIAIYDHDDAIVVATRGQPPPGVSAVDYGIALDGDDIGVLRLWPMPGATIDVHSTELQRSLQMVGLAFDNVLLLQSIARRAVREERMRLARDLHDEIGPSLVSIGLGLDVLIQEEGIEPAGRKRAEEMRATITELVDQVRTTVADLRPAEVSSLVENAEMLAADSPADGPSIVISIDEIEPPDTFVGTQVVAIMTEAVRNAVEHSGGTIVTIEGKSDTPGGWLRITDNGRGISRRAPRTQHYGLVGMQERADEIGASFEVDSSRSKGTTIEVRWGTS
jgi:signal transduction histidine kinase